MSDKPSYHIQKYAMDIQLSDELLAEAKAISEAMTRWQQATPEQRQAWADEAKQKRAQERQAAERRPLTLDALLEQTGWSRLFAEHLCQPYCDCWDSGDGWSYCQHAYDEGLVG